MSNIFALFHPEFIQFLDAGLALRLKYLAHRAVAIVQLHVGEVFVAQSLDYSVPGEIRRGPLPTRQFYNVGGCTVASSVAAKVGGSAGEADGAEICGDHLLASTRPWLVR